MDVQGTLERFSPISSAVAAAFLIILGIIVITQPEVLPWLVGIALILAGTALFAAVFGPGRTSGVPHPRR